MAAIPLRRDVHYPESDGQPMAETPLYQQVMIDAIESLRHRYRGTPDAWVAGNFFLYYREGNPRMKVSPDVTVVRGVGNRWRRVFKLWEEKQTPCFVLEVTSQSSKSEDLTEKKPLYEGLGIEEYFLFDPEGDYLAPRLQGFRLVAGRYQPLEVSADGSLESRATGVRLRPEGERLRLLDAATGEPFLWWEELEALARQETAARREAEARADRLAEELARLRSELDGTRQGG